MKVRRQSKLRSNRRFYQRKRRNKAIRSRNLSINGDFHNAKTFEFKSNPTITPEDLFADDPVAEEAANLLVKLGSWSNDVHIAIKDDVVTETSNGHSITYPLSEANIEEMPNETED